MTEKLTKLKEEMGKLTVYRKRMLMSRDQQISPTDPIARSMATSGRGSGVVGHNVQVAVDTEHHLIVAHEETNSGSDRHNLPIWPSGRRLFQRPRRSKLWPIAATSTAQRFLRATKPAHSYAAKPDTSGTKSDGIRRSANERGRLIAQRRD